MKKLTVWVALCLCSTATLNAQKGNTYHVTQKETILKSAASNTADNLKTLSEYDNVTLLEALDSSQWIKVKYKKLKGFVKVESLAAGKAEITYSRFRIGAYCKDGTSSKATGRGACSRHGGVSQWKYDRKRNVTIIDNE